MCAGGMHRLFDVMPDIAVLAKLTANGCPMAAIMGTAVVMDAVQETFISSTNWTERVGPAAAIATLERYGREAVDNHIMDVGAHFRMAVRAAVPSGRDVACSGVPSLVAYRLEQAERVAESDMTVGLLGAGSLDYDNCKPSAAHSCGIVDGLARAIRDAPAGLGDAEADALPARHRRFRRLTAE